MTDAMGPPLDTSALAPGIAVGIVGPQPSPIRPRRRAAVVFIFATALMDIVAIGLIIPVLPPLVVRFVGDPARGAQVFGVFGAVFALMQFVCSPIQGALSDKFGRRPVLLFSIFGLGLDYIVMALAPNLWWLFAGRVISGITAASFSTANAYIADLMADEPSPSRRASAFGMMGAAFGVGFVLGPSIGGLLGHFGPRWPFWFAAGLALINGLYGLFVLPESLPKAKRSAFTLKNANPLGSLKLYGSHPQLPTFAFVLFLFYLAQQVLQSTFVLYMGYRFHFGPLLVGAMLAVTGVGSILVQTLVVRRFVARFGERGALYTGFAFGAVGLVIYGAADRIWLFMLAVPVFALAGLIMPGLQGLMTRRVDAGRQGRLQGANSGLMAIAGLIGPIVFTQIYAWSIRGPATTPGLAIYSAAALYFVALIVVLRARRLPPGPGAFVQPPPTP